MSDAVTDACATSCTVRAASANDAAEIARLSRQLGPIDTQALASRFLRLLGSAQHACFVAFDDASVRGFVAAERRLLLQFGDRVELIALVVDAPWRRRGIAGRLVAAVEAWAITLDVADMVVRSSLSRDASHAFYREIGYALHKTQHVYTRTLTP